MLTVVTPNKNYIAITLNKNNTNLLTNNYPYAVSEQVTNT